MHIRNFRHSAFRRAKKFMKHELLELDFGIREQGDLASTRFSRDATRQSGPLASSKMHAGEVTGVDMIRECTRGEGEREDGS